MLKKIFFIFAVSFAFNLAWENLHAGFYDNYMGGKITESVLLHATLADACIITLIALPFLFFDILKKHEWLIIVLGIFVAVSIELWALSSGRWAYNDLMPILPILRIGLTPALQLGLLGYLSYKLTERVF